MYADPSRIRKHRVTLYFNDAEARLIEAIHEYVGDEVAPILRKMLMDSAHRVLTGELNLDASARPGEALQNTFSKAA